MCFSVGMYKCPLHYVEVINLISYYIILHIVTSGNNRQEIPPPAPAPEPQQQEQRQEADVCSIHYINFVSLITVNFVMPSQNVQCTNHTSHVSDFSVIYFDMSQPLYFLKIIEHAKRTEKELKVSMSSEKVERLRIV